jgi:hypothetical protein
VDAVSIKGDMIAVAVGGAVLLAAGYYAKKKAGDAGKAIKQAAQDAIPYVDPTSDQNIAYQGASALARWLSGNQGDFGSIIWDYTNKAEPAPGGNGGLTNYTQADADKQADFIRRLENGMSHGL